MKMFSELLYIHQRCIQNFETMIKDQHCMTYAHNVDCKQEAAGTMKELLGYGLDVVISEVNPLSTPNNISLEDIQ